MLMFTVVVVVVVRLLFAKDNLSTFTNNNSHQEIYITNSESTMVHLWRRCCCCCWCCCCCCWWCCCCLSWYCWLWWCSFFPCCSNSLCSCNSEHLKYFQFQFRNDTTNSFFISQNILLILNDRIKEKTLKYLFIAFFFFITKNALVSFLIGNTNQLTYLYSPCPV